MTDRNQMDAIDFLIDILKEHEKNLDKISLRLENTMGMIQQFSEHTLAEDKLSKLEEFVEFKKARYLEEKELGAFSPPERIIADLDKILKVIKRGG